jgi:ADP-heptose:LPS heptosyltransferase
MDFKIPGLIRILAFGGIGDALLMTPSLRAMATADPTRKIIVWSQNPGHESVFRYNPFISSFRYVGWIAKTLYRATAARRWLPYVHTDYSRTMPSLLYSQGAAHIIAEILGTSVQDDKPELFLSATEISTASGTVNKLKRPLIAMHVCAASSPNKHWDIANWEKLVARNANLTFVQIGKRNEPVVRGARALTGIGLRATFAIIRMCDAFVGVDSGLGHAATALQTPAIILFGATTPIIWGHDRNVNLYSHRYCSPCIDLIRSSPCPFSVACMSAISVQEVEEALRTQLSSRKPPQ